MQVPEKYVTAIDLPNAWCSLALAMNHQRDKINHTIEVQGSWSDGAGAVTPGCYPAP